MCMSADNDMKININFTEELKDLDENNENTWIVTAQSNKQIELLQAHKKDVPVFVDGPYFTWVRSKMVEYFIMKSDPLAETLEKIKKIEELDDDNFADLYNVFDDPFKSKNSNKRPELSVHELSDGNVYALCCTGTGSKNSLYSWTKLLEKNGNLLKKFLIVFRDKQKPNYLVDLEKLKFENSEKKQEKTENSK